MWQVTLNVLSCSHSSAKGCFTSQKSLFFSLSPSSYLYSSHSLSASRSLLHPPSLLRRRRCVLFFSLLLLLVIFVSPFTSLPHMKRLWRSQEAALAHALLPFHRWTHALMHVPPHKHRRSGCGIKPLLLRSCIFNKTNPDKTGGTTPPEDGKHRRPIYGPDISIIIK